MGQICVQIPPLERAQTIDLEITIDGEKHFMNYRVESFDWGTGVSSREERVERLKQLISEYNPEYELVQIGNPADDLLPVLFRHRR